MIPYAGFSFYTFEKLKFLCMKYAPDYLCNTCDQNTGTINKNIFVKREHISMSTHIYANARITGGLGLTIPARLLSGGIAGAIAQSFSYPLDVTRRRMQLAMMTPTTHKYR